jgi:mannose-1-phosphate guanylyltransferase
MSRRIIPLIMCGGAGTRLWPASREVHPKQFLPLFGVRSTFQNTILPLELIEVQTGSYLGEDEYHPYRG